MTDNSAPDLYTVGVPRSGTSFLFSMLGQHPDIFAPRPLNASRGLDGVTLASAEAVIDSTRRLDIAGERAVVARAADASFAPPLVSIGMPVRNGAAGIRGALMSLLSQSYPNLAITVCDNASDDGTADIVAEMARADDRITLKRFDTLVNIKDSFARAHATASGDYFMFAPADDSWHPDFISAAVGRMQANPAIAVCCGTIHFVYEDGRITESVGTHAIGGRDATRWRTALVQSGDATRIYGVIRASALAGMFPDAAPEGWDHYSAAKLTLHGEVAHLDMVAMQRAKTPMEAYQRQVFAQEQGFWNRVFFMRHVTRLFRDDPDFDTSRLGARAALLAFLLYYTDLPLRRQRKGWLRWMLRQGGHLCAMIARVAP